ncbi:MAG: 3-oxoacyl-ACP synthase III, partial [Ilumatobacter sp.]
MAENSVLTHRNVGLLTVAAVEAPEVVTSAWIDEQLSDTYERTGLNPGILESLAGIEARRWWPEDVTFEQAAALAGRKALDESGIDPAGVGMLISTSVCKHHLEPSVACVVHHELDLAPSCLNFDVGNACLGFINGMQIAAAAIDAGTIDYALVVDGEGSRHTQQTTIERLQLPDTTATDVFDEFASLTLGSGAAAAVLCRMDKHPDAHRLVGGIARSGTQHNQLCIGSLDQMRTDSHGLMIAGLDLADSGGIQRL